MMDALASRNSRKPCGYSSSPDGAFSISLLGVPDESEKSPVWLGGLDVSMSVTGSVGTVFSSVSDMLGKVLLCRLCRFGLAARCVVDEKPKVGALKSRKKKRDWRPALELRAGTANCRKLNNRQGSQDKKKKKIPSSKKSGIWQGPQGNPPCGPVCQRSAVICCRISNRHLLAKGVADANRRESQTLRDTCGCTFRIGRWHKNTLGACLEMAWRPQPNRRPNWLTRPSCRLIRVCSGVRRLLRAVLTGAKSAIFRRCHWFGRAPCWPSDTSPFNISNKNIAWSPKTAVVAQRKKNVVVERQEKKFIQKQATMSFTPLTRTWRAFNPPTLEKRKDAIKFGILGAANSA